MACRHEWQKLNNPNFGDRKVVTPRVGPGIPPITNKKSQKKKLLDPLSNDPLVSSLNGFGGSNEEDYRILGEVDEDFSPGGEVKGGEGGEEEDSDDETDLILRSFQPLSTSLGLGRPLGGPNAEHAMGSLWIGSRWGKFEKWGVREGFREAFRLGAGGAGAGSGGGVSFGVGR